MPKAKTYNVHVRGSPTVWIGRVAQIAIICCTAIHGVSASSAFSGTNDANGFGATEHSQLVLLYAALEGGVVHNVHLSTTHS